MPPLNSTVRGVVRAWRADGATVQLGKAYFGLTAFMPFAEGPECPEVLAARAAGEGPGAAFPPTLPLPGCVAEGEVRVFRMVGQGPEGTPVISAFEVDRVNRELAQAKELQGRLPEGAAVVAQVIRSDEEQAELRVLQPADVAGVTGKIMRPDYPLIVGSERMYGAGTRAGDQPAPKEGLVLREGLVSEFEVKANSNQGVMFTRRPADNALAWRRALQIKEVCNRNHEVPKVRITRANRGGLISELEGVEVFVPLSEILVRGETVTLDIDLMRDEFVGKEIELSIMKEDVSTFRGRQKRQLIGSCKYARFHHRNAALQPGAVVECWVKRVEDFGAILQPKGTRKMGLLHISEISNEHVEQVSDVFAVGDTAKALILSWTDGGRRMNFCTAVLEAEDGDMLRDPERVYATAEAQGKAFRARMDEEEEEEGEGDPEEDGDFEEEGEDD